VSRPFAPGSIARLWRGRAPAARSRAYERFLSSEILPELDEIPGYEGAYVLRRDAGPEVESLVLTLWRSLDAVRDLARPDYRRAVVAPEAQEFLSEYDEHADHHVVVDADRARGGG
jgi:heme-degrading monooxygenase HmoA